MGAGLIDKWNEIFESLASLAGRREAKKRNLNKPGNRSFTISPRKKTRFNTVRFSAILNTVYILVGGISIAGLVFLSEYIIHSVQGKISRRCSSSAVCIYVNEDE